MKSNEREISAVIPTIGRIRFLDKTIKSVLSQSVPFSEIIVFDNSAEQNLQSLSEFGNNPNLSFVLSGAGLNALDSWNKAVASCRCNYVTIIGDDDILKDDYHQQALELIEASNLGLMRSDLIDENGNVLADNPYPTQDLISFEDFVYFRFKGEVSLFVPGMVFKKDIFFKSGGFVNPCIESFVYTDELLLFCMILLNKNIVLSKTKCWSYRKHENQITNISVLNNLVDNNIRYIELLENKIEFLGGNLSQFYKKFNRYEYFIRVCLYLSTVYGARAYGKERFLKFTIKVFMYFLFNSRLKFILRIKCLYYSLKSFLYKTSFARLVKKAIKK